MNPIKIPAIKFIQNGSIMFLFIAESKTIYENFDVSRRIENKEQGYQRSFSQPRIKEIKNYILQHNGIIPNSILVNLDKGKHSYDNKTQELILNNEGSIGLIIDGQHRVKGSYEADKNLLLPVVATIDLDVKSQAQLFVKINKTQKGVPASLYLDLLELTDGVIEDFDDDSVPAQRRAVEIAKRLNEDSESPLFELIRTTGDSGRGISLSEFVSKLKIYVDPKTGKLLNYGFEQQYRIFRIYFKAIKAVFLEQWEDSNSLILKTVGFGGLMNAFYDIFTLVTQGTTKFSTDNVIGILEYIKDFKFDNKTLPGGGIKAQDSAGKILVSQLRKAIRGAEDKNVEIVD
jgi:DGQHR domain-containing protein